MSEKKSSRKLCALLIAVAAVLVLNSTVAPHAAAADKYKSLYRFKGGKDGSYVFGSLIFDAAGNLYGTTYAGGAANYGTVFELSPNGNGGWTKSLLHSFNGKDGSAPWDGVILDATGNLYGTTSAGGIYGVGTAFELTPNADGSWTENVLHSFKNDGEDGYTPYAELIFDQTGSLYGTTSAGGTNEDGIVFQLSPNRDGSWTENLIHSFSGADGEQPFAGLIFDQVGNLYGTTYQGGDGGSGTVFELSPNRDGTWTEKVLHSFNGQDGEKPFAGLIFDAAGNLYGTTLYGGAEGYGAVFELAPNKNGWTESVLQSFGPANTAGELLNAGLILDQAGNLYGATNVGGRYDWGSVFRLSHAKSRWNETVLHSFKAHPGAEPVAALIFDANGNLYGTTAGDGSSIFGSVFEITP
jgi:uncharacterized repeat protein (TIGR03803 family)